MNSKVVLIALVLCVKLCADSEELIQRKNYIWNSYNKRKLLDIFVDTVDCVPGKTRFKGKCLTNEQIERIIKNDNPDDMEATTTTVTPTPDFDDYNKWVMNATNGTDIVSTSRTDKSKEIDTISTTPTPYGDSNDKRQTNLMNKTSTESTETITTTPKDEHDNKPKTYSTNDTNVPQGPKLLGGDKVHTTSMPNGEVNMYFVAICAAAVCVFLILCFWCLYKKKCGRHLSTTTQSVMAETNLIQRN